MNGAVEQERDARLQTALGGAALRRLRARLRERLESGTSLATSLSIRGPSPEERRAIEALMGRRPGRGTSLSLTPADLEQRLVDAGLAESLADALTRLDGPIEDRAATTAAREVAWAKVDAIIGSLAGTLPLAVQSWQDLTREGQVRRASGDDPATAALLAADYVKLAEALAPALGSRDGTAAMDAEVPAWTSLAELATRVTGDAHGLDPGQPLTAVALRFVASVTGAIDTSQRPDARQLWGAVGVEVDPLSSHVLVLNLPLPGSTPTAVALSAHAAEGEPCRITLRALQRYMPVLVGSALSFAEVFACENPMVVLAAARELGARCRPLLCLEGQPSAAATTLMAALSGAGVRLRYHGDFDWPGMRIATGVLSRHAATPWRLGKVDYVGAPAGPALGGEPVATRWDPALSEAMRARGTAVHEEAVLPTLLGDLAQ